jgi:putative transcriptional regulator
MMKNLVTELRERKGVSKSHLARKIGVCPSYVTKLEKNDLQPSGEIMFRLAEYFKCRIEEVFQPEMARGRK